MTKNKRSVKVYGMCGYKSKLTPTIMLKGKWLSDFGFDVGSYISITCEEGKLIIAPDMERMELEEAMAEFAEQEKKKFQKRFKKDKEVFRAQYVAEQQTKYGQCENENV